MNSRLVNERDCHQPRSRRSSAWSGARNAQARRARPAACRGLPAPNLFLITNPRLKPAPCTSNRFKCFSGLEGEAVACPRFPTCGLCFVPAVLLALLVAAFLLPLPIQWRQLFPPSYRAPKKAILWLRLRRAMPLWRYRFTPADTSLAVSPYSSHPPSTDLSAPNRPRSIRSDLERCCRGSWPLDRGA